MDKDLIVAFSSNYGWDDIKYWVLSAKSHIKADTDLVILTDNMEMTLKDKLESLGVGVFEYNSEREHNIPPHVMRFFILWYYLASLSTPRYNSVLSADIRDVIFQDYPIIHSTEKSLFVASEGLTYKNEPWGKNNFRMAFGDFFYGQIEDRDIYNVGVFCGDHDTVQDLALLIFEISLGKGVADQAAFNFLLSITNSTFGPNLVKRGEWAVHLGTTRRALESGSGCAGALFASSKEYQDLYDNVYDGIQISSMDDTSIVKSSDGYIIPIVHQWDRVPEVKEAIEKKYSNDQ